MPKDRGGAHTPSVGSGDRSLIGPVAATPASEGEESLQSSVAVEHSRLRLLLTSSSVVGGGRLFRRLTDAPAVGCPIMMANVATCSPHFVCLGLRLDPEQGGEMVVESCCGCPPRRGLPEM